MFAIYKKELRSFFINPIGYIYTGAFLGLAALLCCYTTILNGNYVPNADVKIFLTASPEQRAYRRYLELQEKQKDAAPDYETVLQDVIQRDHQDMTRTIAPLRQAEDAVLLDTTEYDLEQSEAMLYQICKERLTEL